MKLLSIVVLGFCLLFCFGFAGSCGMAVGTSLNSGNTGSSKDQPTHKLNYFNKADRQECIERGHEWVKISGKYTCQ